MVILAIIYTLNLLGQNDTIDIVDESYRYEKVGVKHYFVIETKMPDSTTIIQRSAPFKTKSDVVKFASDQKANIDSVLISVNKQYDRDTAYLNQIIKQREQLMYQMDQEILKIKERIKGTRTKRRTLSVSTKKLDSIK